MQLSSKTLAILKNCASITPSLLIKPGNKISTVSMEGDILLRANVEETFPTEISIYDMNQLLGILSMMGNDAEVEFGDRSLEITQGQASIVYFYAGRGIVQWDEKWDQPVNEVKSHFEFALTDKDLSVLQKASSLLNAPKMSISSQNGEVRLIVSDPAIMASNSYRKELGNCDNEFNYIIPFSAFKVMADNYTVKLPKGKKRIQLIGTSYNLQYWIGIDPESEVE